MRPLARLANYLLSFIIAILLLLPIAYASDRLLIWLHRPLGDIVILLIWFFIILRLLPLQMPHVLSAFSHTNLRMAIQKFAAFAILPYLITIVINRYISSSYVVSTAEFLSVMLPTLTLFYVIPRKLFPLFTWGIQRNWTTILRTGDQEAFVSLFQSNTCPPINDKLPDGETPLTYLITYRPDPRVVTILLAHGANANLPNTRGTYPLQAAIAYGHLALVELLLHAGAVAELPLHNSPLHLAAGYGREKILQLFLEMGADVNAINDIGETPLHYGARRGNMLVIETLLQHGANPSIRNHRGETALDLANAQASSFAGVLINTGRKQVAKLLIRMAEGS